MEDTSYYTHLVQSIILDDVPYLRRLLQATRYRIDMDIPFLCFPLGHKEHLGVLRRTPLMIAAMTNSPKVVEYLLACGKADVGKVSPSDGASVFCCAEEAECSPTIINMLYDARERMAQPMDFNETSHTSLLPSTTSHGQSTFNSTQSSHGRLDPNILISTHARGAATERPFSFNHQVDWNMNRSVLEWKRPNIMASPYGAVGEKPTSSNHQLDRNEPNIMTSPYGAVGERPETSLSSNGQIYQNMSVHGRQAEVVIKSSAPDPGFMNEYVHSPGPPANKNSRMQEREEPNIPTPSDARDPSVARTSSSNDQVHQNMKDSKQEVQDSDTVINPSTIKNASVVSEEPNIPTPSDARDPSVGMTSSSNDQVHQNMKDSKQEVQDSDAVINPSTLEKAAVVFDWLNDFPPLTVGGKLVKSARRK